MSFLNFNLGLVHDSGMRKMPSPQTRPEVCWNLLYHVQYFVALIENVSFFRFLVAFLSEGRQILHEIFL